MDEGQAMIVDLRRMIINWDKLMSVMIQTHRSLGYLDVAEMLKLSPIPDDVQPLKLANLRTYFLGGFGEKCGEALCGINGLNEESMSGAMLIILSTWLVERLGLNKRFPLSNVIDSVYVSRLSVDDRQRLTVLHKDIHTLEDGLNDVLVALEFRKMMLKKLDIMLPSVGPTLDKKLVSVIDYGVSAQIYSCLSHNTKDVIPLYCDHSCNEDQLPTKTIQILIRHWHVWYVKFSHNGLYLASASPDRVIIWEVPAAGWQFKKKRVLREHNWAIFYVSWSPNDESLLTCAPLEHIKMWDVRTGQCTRVISEYDNVLRSCEFLMSDQIEIVYGTSLQRPSIRRLRNGHDEELVLLPRQNGHSTFELAVTPNGSKLIYYDRAGSEFTVKDIDSGQTDCFTEEAIILGVSVSEDSKSLILNLSNNEIHVWDLNRLHEERPFTYWNFEQIVGGNYPCIGGVESRFLVSGTKDSKVCIWNRRQARPIAVLSGHKSAVRCVSWNPQRPQMLASASDDGTIRIWGPQSQEVPQLFRHA